MSDDRPVKKKVLFGEVLPPATGHAPDVPPGTPLGIPLLGRALFDARARVFQSYVKLRQAQTDLILTDRDRDVAVRSRLEEQERLEKAFVRLKHLPLILDAEEAKLLGELDDVFEGIRNRGFDKRKTAATLEAEALEAEERLHAAKNRTPPNKEEKFSRAQRIAREILRVKADFAELKEALISAAGGEENLTDDDRSQLDTLELAREDQIKRIMEGL
jgi:hypothetical protein